jgi:glycosyltransferase involved in cell wall biosynthesis
MSVGCLISDLAVITIDLAYERSFGYALIKLMYKSFTKLLYINLPLVALAKWGTQPTEPSRLAISYIMKILSIYYTHKPGGFCKRLYRLLGALTRAGHDVTYLCLDQPPQALSAQVQVIIIPFPLKIRHGAAFWAIFTLWATIIFTFHAWKLKPERIAVFGAYYGALSYPAQRLLTIPVILFIRSLVFKINRITHKPALLCWCSDLLECFAMKRASSLVAMSESMARSLREFIRKERKIEILPNDVQISLQEQQKLAPDIMALIAKKRAANKILLLVSGVFDQRKNLLFVIDALIELTKIEPTHRIELLVAGTGAEISLAKARISATNLTCISFLGWINSPAALLQHIDLLIHPSKHEGMPNSVLEAWGQGLATLLADIAELREMAPGEDLFFAADNINPLLERLHKITLNSERELAKLTQATNNVRSRFIFDWEQKAAHLVINFKQGV